MQRHPKNYDTTASLFSADQEGYDLPTVIDDQEFATFTSGQKSEISDEARKRIKKAMSDAGPKMNMFLMAYAQKGMSRLARVMRVLDSVDKELFQEYRLKFMPTGELLDLFGELNTEQHRSVKEIMDISTKFKEDSNFGSMRALDSAVPLDQEDEERAAIRQLSRKSKKNIIDFFKNKIAVVS